MQGGGGASGPLPESLEFEGRFMSSRPVTNNPMWWHRDQNPVEQQLPDFISLGNTGEGGRSTQRLSIGQSSSSSMKTQSGCTDRLTVDERISSANMDAGAGSGLNNPASIPNINTSNNNLIRPAIVQNSSNEIDKKDFIANRASSGRSCTDHISMGSSSSHSPVELVRSSSLFREENHDGPPSTVLTSYSSEKRKLPDRSWDESSASAHKRSVQISSSSDLQAELSCHTPDNSLVQSSFSANVLGHGSSGSLRSDAVTLARSSFFDTPVSGSAGRSQNIQQNTQIRTDTPLQDSVPAHSVLSGTAIRQNAVIRRPHLVLPPPQAVGEGSNVQNQLMPVAQCPGLNLQVPQAIRVQNHPMPVAQCPRLVLPAPQAVGEGSNVQNPPMPVDQRPRLVLPAPQAVGEGSNVHNQPRPVHYSATQQQSDQLTSHHSASSVNYSGSALATGTIHVQERGLRNSTQDLQLPVIAPLVDSRNSRQNPTNRVPSGGVAITPVNGAPGLLSDPIPSGPRLAPNIGFNATRRRATQQRIRQALFAVDLIPEAYNPPFREVRLQSGANSQGTQTMQQRATLLAMRTDSNFGAPDHNASTSSFDTEARQRLLSRARHMIALYRGGRDIPAPEDGVDVRQSLLSALANIHDQHRDMRLDVDNMSYEELLELGDRIGHVKTGLSEEAIMKCLKHYMYSSTVTSNNLVAEPCSICQEEYAEGEDIGALDCGHEYHTNCIKQWLVQKNSCPICKASVSSSK